MEHPGCMKGSRWSNRHFNPSVRCAAPSGCLREGGARIRSNSSRSDAAAGHLRRIQDVRSQPALEPRAGLSWSGPKRAMRADGLRLARDVRRVRGTQATLVQRLLRGA
jgi:hypothetical protein